MAKKKTDMTIRSMYIKPDAWKELGVLAEKKGSAVASLVREAIEEYLEKRREK